MTKRVARCDETLEGFEYLPCGIILVERFDITLFLTIYPFYAVEGFREREPALISRLIPETGRMGVERQSTRICLCSTLRSTSESATYQSS